MVSSSSVNTPLQANRSPLLLIGLVAGFLAIVTFLPRVVLSASGVAKTGVRQVNSPLVPADERLATFARVEQLLESGTQRDTNEAGRLMDGITSAPLLISESDSVGENETGVSFSSSVLIAKLARQFDDAAARAIPSTPNDGATALQWTQRARRIADALMVTPHPSFSALKTAHYLDSIAGKREAIVLRACGNIAEAKASERQNAALKQLWNTEILPVLGDGKLKQFESDEATATTNARYESLTYAEWAAQIDYLVGLYQKERPFTSQA